MTEAERKQAESEDERRRFPRETLSAALICVCANGRDRANFLLRNISLDGVLLECPEPGKLAVFKQGDEVRVAEVLLGPKEVLEGISGKIVWMRQPFIGLHLPRLLMDSPQSLRAWLAENKLL